MNFYIHLETGILLLFLLMVVGTQAERASVPGYYSRNPRVQIVGLSIVFGLLSLGLGALLYSVSPLLGIALAAGFTLSLIHPANALCFFVHMLFLRPWEILTTHPLLLALPRLLAAVCLVSWLLYPGKCGKPTIRTTRGLILLLSYSAWLFLTTFRVPDITAAQVEWFNIFFKSMIVFLMCLFLIEDEHSVLELERTLVLSTFALVILGFYQYLILPRDAAFGGRLHSIGMLGDSNDLAAGIIIVLPLMLAPAFRPLAPSVQRMGGILFSGISLLAIWYTQSRGALLAFLAQILAFGTLFKAQGRSLRLLGIAAFLGLGYVLALHVSSRSTKEMEISQESRLIYWKAAVNMTLHHPVWGVGFGQYPANYETFASTVKYEWGQRTAHSSWLLAFAESGFVGGFLFIAFFVIVFQIAWIHRRENPDQFYALAGYGVAMSFLSHTYMLYPYLLAGLVLATSAIKERAAHGR
ncbi:MAG: hypothetical protein A2992_04355 [Elusimicrobia bacterium RIFCSPLOWO2_01_FULL_59_12]|nr:MAG: hypothetical protein A2992_04355 [Elusimicrobia bacterium RIFCSPLOWO2_01_FULL_59_12]